MHPDGNFRTGNYTYYKAGGKKSPLDLARMGPGHSRSREEEDFMFVCSPNGAVSALIMCFTLRIKNGIVSVIEPINQWH